MENRIINILKEINDEILEYKGDNLYRDGVLDSIQIVELVVKIEEILGIEISPEMVILENFANKDAIIKFVQKSMREQNER